MCDTHAVCVTVAVLPVALQAVPDEEPVPHAALPPPDAAAPLGLHRVLPEVVHGNALLHLLLPGGNALAPGPSRLRSPSYWPLQSGPVLSLLHLNNLSFKGITGPEVTYFR